jgi:poly-gamma-glutamate synthesis protein (capsule biosynthesis protein)
MKRANSVISILYAIAIAALVLSCSSIPNQSASARSHDSASQESSLNLAFVGDIMSHEVNYSMRDYATIYDRVTPALKSADFCFGNLEVPVAETLPLSSYPRFNVHSSYVKAAIDAGFSVFSLANNHSNDQGTVGIEGTLDCMKTLEPAVRSSGLRHFDGEPMREITLAKGDRAVVFLAVTEILNSHDRSAKRVYYVAPDKKSREAFLGEIRAIRARHPRAVFVLSIHLNEPEYVRVVSASKRAWFRELKDAGVDIVWGSHPHVMQEWELVDSGPSNATKKALLMYSMGNFISGQRFSINREDPGAMREYTGDGVIMRVEITGDSLAATPIPVTNYTDPSAGPVIRPFDESFVSSLKPSLRSYYETRYGLMRAYLPLPPMPVRAILD